MGRHLSLAKQFVEEQCQQRQDLIGALLVGSVAYDQATEFSDLDIRLIVEGRPDVPLDRHGIDVWREGIYIDALPIAWADYSDLERLLSHPIRANDLNSGRILYDPTGQLALRQEQVQALFLSPQYVARRVQSLAKRLPPYLAQWQQAHASNDALQLCIFTGRIVFGLGVLPLIQHGIAPSSTRHLGQLAQLAPAFYEQLCELEGSTQLSETEALNCHRLFAQLSGVSDRAKWGNLPDYIVKKTAWMLHDGSMPAALHTMWINSGFRINDCLQSDEPTARVTAEQIVHAWLQAVHWGDTGTIDGKWQQINRLWAELQTILTKHA
jgi:hypothetical protein